MNKVIETKFSEQNMLKQSSSDPQNPDED